MTDPSLPCPRCGAPSPPIQEAFDSMPPLLRMQWKTTLGRQNREWLFGFGFAWILILAGLLFLWIARHDPVNEGQVGIVSMVLSGGSILGGLWLFSVSARDWREARAQAPNRVLLESGHYCGVCGLVWDQSRQASLND